MAIIFEKFIQIRTSSNVNFLTEYEKNTPSPPPASDSSMNTPYYEKKNSPIFKTK